MNFVNLLAFHEIIYAESKHQEIIEPKSMFNYKECHRALNPSHYSSFMWKLDLILIQYVCIALQLTFFLGTKN